MSTTTSLPAGDTGVPQQKIGRVAFELAGNVLLSLFFLQFVIIHGRNFLAEYRLSTLLLVIKVATDVVFYLIRRVPKEVSVHPYDWAVGLMGTFMIAFFRPEAHGTDNLLAQGLQLIGAGLQIAAMLSLNTSIGITAANRGVKTGGMYRFVRHPLYFSYIVAYGGYLISHFTPQNAMVYSAAVLLWVLRLVAEERLLVRDPKYAAFRERVRWRLIPYVF
jgi:protein-S-isoprenylcysteine O-methyltransferase Ste14